MPFFDFRDTSYSGSISAVIDSIAYYVERKPPSDSIRVRIGGLTEFGESPEFSEGEMLRLRDSVRQSIAEAFAKKHVRDSARRAEADAISDLKLISKFAEPVEIDYEMTEEERAAADSLLDAAFASMRKTQDYVVPPQLPGDSLLGLGRAETIRSRILSSGICGHCMFDYYGWDITRYVDLPEERYYQRSVTVLVSHGFKRPRD